MISKTYENTSKRDFFTKFFQFYNIVIPEKGKKLNNREIELLSEFLSLDQDKYKITRFSALGKTKVIENIKERHGRELDILSINTHITNLKKKGLIVTQSDRINYLSPKLLKLIEIVKGGKEIDFSFKFIIQ